MRREEDRKIDGSGNRVVDSSSSKWINRTDHSNQYVSPFTIWYPKRKHMKKRNINPNPFV